MTVDELIVELLWLQSKGKGQYTVKYSEEMCDDDLEVKNLMAYPSDEVVLLME